MFSKCVVKPSIVKKISRLFLNSKNYFLLYGKEIKRFYTFASMLENNCLFFQMLKCRKRKKLALYTADVKNILPQTISEDSFVGWYEQKLFYVCLFVFLSVCLFIIFISLTNIYLAVLYFLALTNLGLVFFLFPSLNFICLSFLHLSFSIVE